METRPPEKRLRMAPFIMHATRGVIRDQRVRRRTMGILLIVAVIMIATGTFALGAWLDPREHRALFLFFWLACAWLTITALLLALLDLLILRVEARRGREALREETKAEINPPPE